MTKRKRKLWFFLAIPHPHQHWPQMRVENYLCAERRSSAGLCPQRGQRCVVKAEVAKANNVFLIGRSRLGLNQRKTCPIEINASEGRLFRRQSHGSFGRFECDPSVIEEVDVRLARIDGYLRKER